ncbi:MAG: tetratricopeptide repeat protein, partial [Zavarzinella sp.]|nr:tetratricopeptide repeat protein [Zavarzinella sp.]
VTPAVEAIVRKCLEPDVENRYVSAAALRDDLARQRSHQRLLHAPEASLRERARKWARRNPKLVSPAALAAYLAAVVLIVSAVTVQLSLSARAKRQDADRIAALRHYEQFLALADRAKIAAGSPAESAELLHLGTEALALYSATEPAWADRDEVIRLPAVERERLKGEVGELAFLTARAAAQVRHDADLARRLNNLAVEALGPQAKPAADAQRSELTGLTPAELSQAVGDGGRAGFLRACDLAARGRHREALPLATAFVAKNPDDFGGWYLKARCHDVLGQYEDARAAYATCAALRPLSPRPLAARGNLAFRHAKDLDQAKADLDRALELDPNLVEARLTRALVLRGTRRYAEALADLDRLARDPNAPTRVYFVRAQVREATGDKAGAAADRAEGMNREPRDPASFVTRGLAKAPKDPEAALADFRAGEALDPLDPDPMVNQAWLLGEQMGRTADALAAVDRLLALYPDHPTGQGGRAVLLARLGRTEEAVAQARKCLENPSHALAYYQAGCAFAIVSAKDPKYRD